MAEIRTKYLWLVILLTLVVYFISMFLDLMGPGTVQYAQITREMFETGGFLQVTYLGDN